jgi:hypothetical protein
MVFDSSPSASTQATSARFVFHPDEATNGKTTCRLDGGTSLDCTNGSFDAAGLAPGAHTLAITAQDKAGTAKTTSYSWTIDQTDPVATITGGPPPYWSSTSATLTFSANEPLSGTYCRRDTAFMFSPCTSPVTYSLLKDGSHTVSVVVADKAKNYAAWATYSWVQDTVRPSITISGGPTGTTTSTTASFTLASNEPGTFRCSWDGESYAVCTSPETRSGLGSGSHTFSAQAVDRAGNVSSPATRTWTIAP